MSSKIRVKSGFGRLAKFGQRPCWFHILIIGIIIAIKNKLTKQSENTDETAHKEPSHLDFHCSQMYVRIYLMSEVTRLYPMYVIGQRHA